MRVAPPVDPTVHPWAQRFADKVNVREDGCWEWLGMRDRRYGRFYAGGGNNAEKWAHRRSYEMFVGPIPEGLEIDHLCRFTFCVNPEHLEAVTHEENMRRAAAARDLLGHGTEACYLRGCRRDECCAAQRERSLERRERRRADFAAGLIEIEHGTAHGYRHYLCRCEPCLLAGRADGERQRRARGMKPKVVAQHGTTTMYTAPRNCRCDDCRRAWRDYWRAHRARKREEAA